MRPYTPPSTIFYQEMSLITEGMVKLRMAGTHIDFEVVPQLEGFILGRSEM